MTEITPEEHAEVQLALQGAINRVARTHLGGAVVDVRAALEQELRTSGHWPQPERWMRAVSEDMADGRIYITGKSVYRDPRGH
jgi:hypothetical protein